MKVVSSAYFDGLSDSIEPRLAEETRNIAVAARGASAAAVRFAWDTPSHCRAHFSSIDRMKLVF